MFTVVVGLEWSGKSSTRSPFLSWYSVMPSTDVTRLTPAGRAGAVWASAGPTLSPSRANAANWVRKRNFFCMRKEDE